MDANDRCRGRQRRGGEREDECPSDGGAQACAPPHPAGEPALPANPPGVLDPSSHEGLVWGDPCRWPVLSRPLPPAARAGPHRPPLPGPSGRTSVPVLCLLGVRFLKPVLVPGGRQWFSLTPCPSAAPQPCPPGNPVPTLGTPWAWAPRRELGVCNTAFCPTSPKRVAEMWCHRNVLCDIVTGKEASRNAT